MGGDANGAIGTSETLFGSAAAWRGVYFSSGRKKVMGLFFAEFVLVFLASLAPPPHFSFTPASSGALPTTMASRKRTLLKVIILGDSGYVRFFVTNRTPVQSSNAPRNDYELERSNTTSCPMLPFDPDRGWAYPRSKRVKPAS